MRPGLAATPNHRRPVPHTLRELRTNRGWTLRELADRSGVLFSVISQIERGRIVATGEEAARLAAALELPAGALRLSATLVYEEPAADERRTP
jgi:transcriptional regulator with XRE-family HTH domain